MKRERRYSNGACGIAPGNLKLAAKSAVSAFQSGTRIQLVREMERAFSAEILLMAMNLGTLSQAIVELAPLALSALSRSAAMDHQRRRSDRNRELAELR